MSQLPREPQCERCESVDVRTSRRGDPLRLGAVLPWFSSRRRPYRFSCRSCGHAWSWVPGTRWRAIVNGQVHELLPATEGKVAGLYMGRDPGLHYASDAGGGLGEYLLGVLVGGLVLAFVVVDHPLVNEWRAVVVQSVTEALRAVQPET